MDRRSFVIGTAVTTAALGTGSCALSAVAEDPYRIIELQIPIYDIAGRQDTTGKSLRSKVLDLNLRNSVWVWLGCSNNAGIAPKSYTPTHGSAIDNFNVYDGLNYAAVDPLVGCSPRTQTAPYGFGTICLKCADHFIGDNLRDRIVLCPIAQGGSKFVHWGSNGVCRTRLRAIINRCKDNNLRITRFMLDLGQNDAAMKVGDGLPHMQSMVAYAQSLGCDAKWIIAKHSWTNGRNANVRADLTAIVDNVNVFAGPDLDALGNSYRMEDAIHFHDDGQVVAAALWQASIIAAGPDY